GIVRKLIGKSKCSNDRECIDARLAVSPQHLGNHAFAAILRRGEAKHLEDDFVLGLGPFGAGVADEDAMAEDSAIDADIAEAVALEISADELARRALDDPHDLTDRAAAWPLRLFGEPDQDFVAGHGVQGVRFAHQYFRPRLVVDGVRPDEAE